MEAGLDSLGAVELRNQLASHFSLDLTPTLTFDYPTASALASHIASRLAVLKGAGSEAREPGVGALQPVYSLADLEEEIAQIVAGVIGMIVNKQQVIYAYSFSDKDM